MSKKTDLEQLTESQARVTELEGQLDTSEGKVTKLEADLKAANEKITKLEGELKTSSEKVTKIEGDLKVATDKVTKIEGENKSAEEKAREIAAASGVTATAKADTALNAAAKVMTRSEFTALSNSAKSAFCKAGGKLTD